MPENFTNFKDTNFLCVTWKADIIYRKKGNNKKLIFFYQTFNRPLIKMLRTQKILAKDQNSYLPIFLQLLAAHCTALSGNTLEANCRKCNFHIKDFLWQHCGVFKVLRYSRSNVL